MSAPSHQVGAKRVTNQTAIIAQHPLMKLIVLCIQVDLFVPTQMANLPIPVPQESVEELEVVVYVQEIV
jgi:hypothetical protein